MILPGRPLAATLALLLGLMPLSALAQAGTLQDLAKEFLERLGNPDAPADPVQAPAAPSRAAAPPPAVVVPASVNSTDRAIAEELLSATDTPADREIARRRLGEEFYRRINRRFSEPTQTELAALPPGSSAVVQLPTVRPEDSIADGEELIMEVRVAQLRFVQSVFTIKRGNGVMVDLAEIAAVMELALQVDARAGTAKGFILSEDNTFELDANRGAIIVRGQTRPIKPDDVEEIDGRLFVHSSAFVDWFGIRLTIDFRGLAINVESDDALPVQQRLERRQRFGDQTRIRSQEATLPEATRPYAPFSLPFVDVSAGTSVVDRPGQKPVARGTYSAIGRGDFAYATSEFFIAGDDIEPVTTARLTLRREDPGGRLLGPLQATQFEVGDVRGASVPLIGGGGFGRGVRVTNLAFGDQISSAVTSFAGNEQPGTDVELYRNGVLIDLQQVGPEGRYDFRDVPLFLGRNEFRLVFYGAQGGIREERQVRNISSSGPAGSLPVYEFALVEPNRDLFQIIDSGQLADPLGGALALRKTFDGGWSLSTGAFLEDLNDTSSALGSLGIGLPVGNALVSLDTAGGVAGGTAASATLRTFLFNQTLNLRQSYFDDLRDRNELSTAVAMQGQLGRAFGRAIPYNASAEHSELDRGGTEDRLAFGASTGFGRIRIANNLSYLHSNPDGQASTRSMFGLFQSTAFLPPAVARAGVTYQVDNPRISALNGNLDFTINSRVTTRFAIDHFIDSERTNYTAGLNWRFEKFVISPAVSYNTDRQIFALLNLRTAIGYDPMRRMLVANNTNLSDSGAIAARVYLDENRNGRFDTGESPISGARIDAAQSGRFAVTDDNGFAFMDRVPSYRRTDVTLRRSSLPDPYMAPAQKGNSYLPRPGVVERIDIPVTTTSEVDGTLFAQRGDGEAPQALSATAIILRDENGREVAREVTSFDGFYLFTDIPPGTYTVEADAADLLTRNFVPSAPRRIFVGDKGEVSSGNDILVGREGMSLSQPGTAPTASLGLPTLSDIAPARPGALGAPGELLAAVNLGAYRSLAGIDAGWRLLRTVYAEDLRGLEPVAPFAAQPQSGPAENYDLLLGPLPAAEAEAVCARLREKRLICSVTKLPMTAAPATPVSAAPQPPAAVRPTAAVPIPLPNLSPTAVASASIPLPAAPVPLPPPAAPPATTPAPSSTPPQITAPMAIARPTDAQPVTPVAVTPAELAVVKLGTYRSRTGLDAGWQLLRRMHAGILGNFAPLPPKEPDGNDASYDLLLGPFDPPAARNICADLASRSQICTVTTVPVSG